MQENGARVRCRDLASIYKIIVCFEIASDMKAEKSRFIKCQPCAQFLVISFLGEVEKRAICGASFCD